MHHYKPCENVQSTYWLDVSVVGAKKVYTRKKVTSSGMSLNFVLKFIFIWATLSTLSTLHIYSTVPHAKMQSIPGWGKAFSSNLQYSPGNQVGLSNKLLWS